MNLYCKINHIKPYILCIVAALLSGCNTIRMPENMPTSAPTAFTIKTNNTYYSQTNSFLTLQDAINKALTVNPEISAAKATLNIAFQRAKAVGDLRDPELRAAYGNADTDITRTEMSPDSPGTMPYKSRNESDDFDSYGFALRIFPTNPWLRHQSISAATASLNAAKSIFEQKKIITESAVKKAFSSVIYAKSDLALVNKLVTIHKNNFQQIQKGKDAGQMDIQQSAVAARRYLQVLQEKKQAEQIYEQARQSLSELCLIPYQNIKPVSEPVINNATLQFYNNDISTLEQYAMSNRADIIALSWITYAAQAAYKEKQTEQWPWLKHLQASYGKRTGNSHTTELSQQNGTSIYSGSNDESSDRDEWAISAAINIPIFSILGHNDDLAMAQWRLAQIEEQSAVTAISSKIKLYRNKLKELKHQNNEYEKASKPIISTINNILHSPDAVNTLLPAEKVKLEEQLITHKRTILKNKYELTQTYLNLEETLGGTIQ